MMSLQLPNCFFLSNHQREDKEGKGLFSSPNKKMEVISKGYCCCSTNEQLCLWRCPGENLAYRRTSSCKDISEILFYYFQFIYLFFGQMLGELPIYIAPMCHHSCLRAHLISADCCLQSQRAVVTMYAL